MRSLSAALALALAAACGYSEGGTTVTLRAVHDRRVDCGWTRAQLTLTQVELVPTSAGAALHAAHGDLEEVTSLRVELATTGTTALVELHPPPGDYASLRLAWGPDHERGWPLIEATTGTTTVERVDGGGERALVLAGARLDPDASAEILVRGWHCPPALDRLSMDALSATWR